MSKTIARWKQSSMAWSIGETAALYMLCLQRILSYQGVAKSGRMMWNLGMWLDAHWSELSARDQVHTLEQIAAIMGKARHNRALGVWKLGDTLGEHIGTAQAKLLLLNIVASKATILAKWSALHGLVHHGSNHPRARQQLIAVLRQLSQKHNEPKLDTAFHEAIRAITAGSGCWRDPFAQGYS